MLYNAFQHFKTYVQQRVSSRFDPIVTGHGYSARRFDKIVNMAPVMSRQDSQARAREAERLVACGRTFAEVANELGYGSAGACHTAIKRLRQRTPLPTADAARRSSAEGLRVLRSVLFEQLADAKQRDDNDALVSLAKELRANITEDARLHGAHAPQKTEVDVNVNQTATAIISDARERLLSVIDGEVVQPKELTT